MSNEALRELHGKIDGLLQWTQETDIPLETVFTMIDNIRFEHRFRMLTNFYRQQEHEAKQQNVVFA